MRICAIMFLCACIPPDLGVNSLVPAQAIRPPALAHIKKTESSHLVYNTKKESRSSPFGLDRWLVITFLECHDFDGSLHIVSLSGYNAFPDYTQRYGVQLIVDLSFYETPILFYERLKSLYKASLTSIIKKAGL